MSNLVTIPTSRVREILAVNRNGGKVDSILGEEFEPQVEEPTYRTEEDSITRFDKAKKRKKKSRNRGNLDERRETRDERQNDIKVKDERRETRDESKANDNSGENKGENKGGHRHNRKHRHHHNKPKQE
jgi:hypothetical protein